MGAQRSMTHSITASSTLLQSSRRNWRYWTSLTHRSIGHRRITAIPEVGGGLPDCVYLVSHLGVCVRVRGDFRSHLFPGLALEAGEEGVYVRMGEQVGRHPGIHAGHYACEVGGRAARRIGGGGRCGTDKRRTGDHAGANEAVEEHSGLLGFVGDRGLCSTWTDTTSTARPAWASEIGRREDHIDVPAVVAVPRVGTVGRVVRPRRGCILTTATHRALRTHGGIAGVHTIRRRR